MKKRISLLLSSIIILSMLAGCASKTTGSEVVIPEFDESDEVTFTAYSAPTLNTKVTPEVEEAYQKLAEAGFKKVQALTEGQSSKTGNDVFETIRKRSAYAQDVALTALDFSEKYGMKYWVRDWTFYGLTYNYKDFTKEEYERVVNEMFTEDNLYIDHPAYGGNFGHDEPDVQLMEKIVWQVKAYQKCIEENSATGGEIFINLLPEYAEPKLLSAKSDFTYNQYLDYYFENLAPLLGYICYDYYPLAATNMGEKYVKDGYFHNHELIAQKCKENDVEFRAFIQSRGDTGALRQLEHLSELRFQIYSSMAFGVNEFIYYTYSTAGDEQDASKGYGPYNSKTGEHTWIYDATKEVNNQILAMDHAYLAYKWDGIMYKNADDMVENPLFMNLEAPRASHHRMEIVSCTQDVLAGVFEAKKADNEAEDAFMFVNASEPSQLLNSEVTVKFENASALLMYRLGEEIVVDLDEDGTYTFVLEPGEGRFVIPLK